MSDEVEIVCITSAQSKRVKERKQLDDLSYFYLNLEKGTLKGPICQGVENALTATSSPCHEMFPN